MDREWIGEIDGFEAKDKGGDTYQDQQPSARSRDRVFFHLDPNRF
jgi:hypothetical protein